MLHVMVLDGKGTTRQQFNVKVSLRVRKRRREEGRKKKEEGRGRREEGIAACPSRHRGEGSKVVTK